MKQSSLPHGKTRKKQMMAMAKICMQMCCGQFDQFEKFCDGIKSSGQMMEEVRIKELIAAERHVLSRARTHAPCLCVLRARHLPLGLTSKYICLRRQLLNETRGFDLGTGEKLQENTPRMCSYCWQLIPIGPNLGGLTNVRPW